MKHYNEFDNRDAAQMYEYLEARIQALKGRIGALERENETLRRGGAVMEPRKDSSVRFEAKDSQIKSAAAAVA